MARRCVIRYAAIALVAAVAAAGITAPFIKADRYRDRIRESLERSLGRRVEAGRVRLNVFTGPGFTIDNVLIYENPAYGVEPLAHVLTLDARVGWTSLWHRRLEFSALRLTEPTVNLVRREEGGWNLVPLLEESLKAQQTAGIPLPYIEVRAGKLLFKTGDTKSPFYLTNADVNVWPRDGGRDGFDVRFSAEPARTDRTSQGFATLSGRGRWTAPRGGDSRLNLELTLERTGMDEIARLLRGQAFGVHGFLTSTAQLSGPLSDLTLAGQLRIEDVHRWDLLPARGSMGIKYTGRIDWRGQSATVKLADAALPVTTTLYLDRFIDQPAWRAEFNVAALPAGNIVEVARHFGLTIPEGLTIDGQIGGTATWAGGAGWNGLLDVSESRLTLGDATRFVFEPSQVVLEGHRIRLAPTSVTGEGGQSADIAAEYDRQNDSVDLQIRAAALSIAEVQSGAGHIFREAAVPLIERVRRGTWTGSLRYRTTLGTRGSWSGQLNLRDVLADVPGLADPVRIRAASVTLEGDRAVLNRMRARAGKLDFFGEYRYEPAALRPHRFNVAVPEADIVEVERLLLPTIRREQGFLARLRGRAAPPPAWLRERRAEGTIRIGALSAGDLKLSGVRALAVWDGTQVTLTARDARFEEGVVRATAVADLSAPQPRYRIEANVRGLTWHAGKVDFRSVTTTRGTGTDALLNLTSKGTFEAEAVAVLPDTAVRSATGGYELTISRNGPSIRLTDLQAALGTENFSGEAATLADGTLRVDLASARRTMRFTMDQSLWGRLQPAAGLSPPSSYPQK